MSGFEQLPGAVNEGAALAPQTPEQTAFSDEQLADQQALGLVLTDASTAEKFVSAKALPASWNQNDDDFRAFVQSKTWPNSSVKRASLGMPLILEVIESLLAQIFLAFFSDKTPFVLTAQGVTPQPAARAAAKILKWAVKKSGFKAAIRRILKSCLLYGTGIGKWGGERGERREKSYSQENGSIISQSKPVPYWCPTFEHVDVRNILVDPSVRTGDIRDAKFVILQKFITANDLDDLRDDETLKNVPTRDALRTILALKGEGATDSVPATKAETWRENQADKQTAETSSDPLQQPLELLMYVTEDRVIVVLQRKVILRNDDNEDECLSFLSAPFIEVLNAFWGLGVGKLLEGEQKFETGVSNAWIDALALKLSPWFHRKKGVGAGSQNIQISPGKVVNDDGELAPGETESVTQEALQAIQISEARARRRVGANFGPDMPTQAMRTAEGVQEFTSGIQTRIQYFVEQFADSVFVPALEAMLVQCKDNMTPDDINRVLTEEEGHAFDGDILEFYKGLYGIEVLSSTKLASKRAMVSLIPTLMQLFSAAPVQQAMLVQAKKLDFAAFLEDVIDLTGWDYNDLIVDATPEDIQRAMMLNPAAIKAQSDMQITNQEHQNDLETESAKGDVRAGVQVVKHILDQSAAPEKPLATRPGK